MIPAASMSEVCREGTRRTVMPVVVAFAVAFHSVWLPAHLASGAHLGARHSHDPAGQRALVSGRPAGQGHGHHRGDHAHGPQDADHHPHAHPATPPDEDHEPPIGDEDHDPHEPYHPITDHQPPVAANQGVSAPTLALIEAQLRLPEPLLLARVRPRPPPVWRGVPPPQPFRSRAPPSA